MQVRVHHEPIEKVKADWLIVGAFEGPSAPPPTGPMAPWLTPRLDALRKGNDFEGKANELLPIYFGLDGLGAQRVLLVGLGKIDQCTRMTVSRAATAAIRHIAKQPREAVAFEPLGGGGELPLEDRVSALATGAQIGGLGPDHYRTEKKRRPIEKVWIVCDSDDRPGLESACERGEIVGKAVNGARRLVNLAPAELSPEAFVDRARELIGDTTEIQTEILGPVELAAQGMNCILAVGGGSHRPPRLLVLRYHASTAPMTRTLALVGKGITFDSGGLSIKTAEGMQDMKCDMAGAAAVLAATWAIVRLKLPMDLIAVIPLADNMPSGSAYKPGDVLVAKNKRTIEVLNTDAEGRLVLADALCHAVDLGASHIVDLATLTGACMVALGTHVGGVMTNRREWADEVLAAADRAGEKVWPLPMFEEYDELIDSTFADMKNIGGKYAGAITGAKLLSRFVDNRPWTHIDIAGPAWAEKESAYQDMGGTGYFVRSLIELARSFVSPSFGKAKA
jgi:leucyl aminopeptidase